MTEAKTETPVKTEIDTPEDKIKLCLMLYAIFAGSLVLQFFTIWTAVVGTAAILAGIIIAYMERKQAFGTLYGNHLQWLIRTFWIGGAVYLPICTVIACGTMLVFFDWEPMTSSFSTGEGNLKKMLSDLFTANQKVMLVVMLACTSPFALWWWWRCWYGYKRLKAGKPIPNAMSWF